MNGELKRVKVDLAKIFILRGEEYLLHDVGEYEDEINIAKDELRWGLVDVMNKEETK